MKLYLNGTSPFARFIRAAALELGQDMELEWVDPWSDHPTLLSINPLSRVPALVLDDGTVLTETLLILRWMTANSEGADLDTQTLSELGTAYGIMELAFSFTIHKKHCGDAGAALQSRRQASLTRGLHLMETAVAENPQWSLSRLCLWIALDYIRFRNVIEMDANRNSELAAFTASNADRAALRDTSFG